MPQYETGRCPAYSQNRTEGCETGCYVEAPHGIVVELQCGLEPKLAAVDEDGKCRLQATSYKAHATSL